MRKIVIKKALSILLYGIVPISLVLLLLLAVFAGEKKLILYPGKNILSGTFGDYEEPAGNSIINWFDVSLERIALSYTLKNGFVNPYAGFAVRSDSWMNLEPFDAMRIKIASTHSESVRVFLFTKIPGYTRDNDSNTFLHLQKEITLRADRQEYTVKFADLYTPEWWYERELGENDPRLRRNFAKVFSVSIQSGTTQPVDIVDIITVDEISFYKSDLTSLVIPIFLLFFYTCAILAFFRIRHYKNGLAKKIDKVVHAFRDISPDRSFDESDRSIIRYIGENYCKQDLTVDTVSHACMIPVMKIPLCLKNHFDLSFPQYLNAIRLAEAKRLLKETDLMISEIAFRIGFNSIPHFNRVFKDNEKISPKDFRRTSSREPGEKW